MQGFYTFSVTTASCQLVLTQSVAATPGMRGWSYAKIPYFFVIQDVHAAGKKRHTCPPARQPARLHASMPAYTPFTYHHWPGSVCPLACMRDFSFLDCSSIHWRLTHWFTITSLLNLLVLLHHVLSLNFEDIGAQQVVITIIIVKQIWCYYTYNY